MNKGKEIFIFNGLKVPIKYIKESKVKNIEETPYLDLELHIPFEDSECGFEFLNISKHKEE